MHNNHKVTIAVNILDEIEPNENFLKQIILNDETNFHTSDIYIATALEFEQMKSFDTFVEHELKSQKSLSFELLIRIILLTTFSFLKTL